MPFLGTTLGDHALIIGPLIFLFIFSTILLLLYFNFKTLSKRKPKISRQFSTGLPLPKEIPQDSILTQDEYFKILTWSEDKQLTTLEEITGSKQFSFIAQCILESDPRIIKGYKEYQHNTTPTKYWKNRTNYLLTNKTMDDYVQSEDFWLCVFNADPAMGKLLLSLQSEETNSRVYGFLALQLLSPPKEREPKYNFMMGKTKGGKSTAIMHQLKLRQVMRSRSLKSYFQRFILRFTDT